MLCVVSINMRDAFPNLISLSVSTKVFPVLNLKNLLKATSDIEAQLRHFSEGMSFQNSYSDMPLRIQFSCYCKKFSQSFGKCNQTAFACRGKWRGHAGSTLIPTQNRIHALSEVKQAGMMATMVSFENRIPRSDLSNMLRIWLIWLRCKFIVKRSVKLNSDLFYLLLLHLLVNHAC